MTATRSRPPAPSGTASEATTGARAPRASRRACRRRARPRARGAAGRPPPARGGVAAAAAGADAGAPRAAARGERRRAVGVEIDDHDLPRRRRQRERALRAAADERAVADLRALRVVAVAVARRRDALKRQRHARRADLVGAVVVLPARQRRVVERERERRLDVAVLTPRRRSAGEEVEIATSRRRAPRRAPTARRRPRATRTRRARIARCPQNCGEQEGAAHRRESVNTPRLSAPPSPSPSPMARTTPTRRWPPSSSSSRGRPPPARPPPAHPRLHYAACWAGDHDRDAVRGDAAQRRDAEAFKGGMTVKKINAAFGERAGELKKPAKAGRPHRHEGRPTCSRCESNLGRGRGGTATRECGARDARTSNERCGTSRLKILRPTNGANFRLQRATRSTPRPPRVSPTAPSPPAAPTARVRRRMRRPPPRRRAAARRAASPAAAA